MQSRSARKGPWLVAILVLIVAGIIAFFAGGWLARNKSAARVEVVQAQLQTARKQLAASESLNYLLRAGNAVYRAAEAVDNRNFGTANSYVRTAVADLNAIDATSAGVDAQKLAAVKEEAAGVKVSVATNLQSQRAAILRLANAIDAVRKR